MDGFLRNISLSGALRGSAVIRENNGKSHIRLAVRGLFPEAQSGRSQHMLSLYSVGSAGMIRTELSGPEADVLQDGICALVITEDGRLKTGGFTGSCAANRARLLDEIRIREASAAVPQAASAGRLSPNKAQKQPQKEIKKKAPRPMADVTSSILEQAERLFSVLNTLRAGIGEEAKQEAEPVKAPSGVKEKNSGYRTIPNPFPRTFPGYSWSMKDGDGRLFGEKGQKRLIAVPVGRGMKIMRAPGIITSTNGRRWMVERTDHR